jgi:hypothetical protein
LLRAARPVLLVLTEGSDATTAAGGWAGRVDTVTATTPNAPADALLLRPDGYVAWAGDADDTDGLRRALHAWFGQPARAEAEVA